MVIISLGMFFTHYSYVAPFDKFYNGFRAGFVENRLYGIFSDPNFAGATSVAVVFLAVKLLMTNKNKMAKIYSIVMIFFNLLTSFCLDQEQQRLLWYCVLILLSSLLSITDLGRRLLLNCYWQ
ncbi:hypothetical protein ACQVGZ_13140 [Enterococcus lactis]